MFTKSWIRNLFSFQPSKPFKKSKPQASFQPLQLLNLEERVTPSTFTVMNTMDSGPNSLRQAIIDANASDAEPDIINIDVGGTIPLESSLPAIDFASTLTINGPSPSNESGNTSVIISGNNGNSSRDFNIFNIYQGGDLTISGVTVSGANSFSLNGGAFNNLGTLSIFNSTISGNTVKNSGGAIYNGGTLTLTNSTIAGNTSNEGFGGAIFNQSSKTLTITNSTLSGNGAFEGGAIYNGGTFNISNTILADSTKGGDFDGPGAVNLIGSSTQANNLTTQSGLSWATTKTSAEINLGTLQDNGGATFTMALGATSAAIGTANADISNANPVNGVDQRGFIRSSTTPSIGAFEFNGVSPAPTVTRVSPSSGPALGGTVITITGTKFTGASRVHIGGNFASFTVENSTTITATVPITNIGPGSVLVTTAYGTNAANTLFTGIGPANTPAFGTPTSTADGFTVQISNYHKSYTYTGTATAGGTVVITNIGSGKGLVTVTGVPGNTSSTVTITTTRTNFYSGSSQVTASSLNAVNTPTFGTPVPTANGFTVQISNYDAAFTYVGTATANGTVAIDGTGLVTVTGVAANTASTATITTSRTNFGNGSATVTATSLASTAPLVTGTPAASSGGSSTVTLYNPNTGAPTGTATPFPGFKGSVTVASGDFDNDGEIEIVVAAGPGGGPAISILDFETGVARAAFFAYGQGFTGGVFVAVKDFNNDGVMDIITGAGTGGGPHVKVFDGRNLQEIASFFAYSQDFSGGVSVAAADFNRDNVLDIVTGAGPGGGPHIKVFDGRTIIANINPTILSQWFAYNPNFNGGVFVAAGDISNDGNIEVITGAGAGGAPEVSVWNPLTGAPLGQFMAYDPGFTGGVRVGVFDGNSDGIIDLVTGAGPGGGPEVRVFSLTTLDRLFSFYCGEATNTGGVFVNVG